MRVTHRTEYTYDEAVASYNEARMTPARTLEQYVLHSRIEVSPSPWSMTYTDYWGTQVTAFEVQDPHDELVVTATSTVEVGRPAAAGDPVSWSRLRDPELVDNFCEYLAPSRWVDPPDDLAERLRSMTEAAPTPGTYARDVCDLVHGEVAYVAGSTQVTGTAGDAWAARSGVCQDISHLAIGALRQAGIPARYVSGYLHPRSAPEVGDPVAGESHAWVEWWDGAWVAYDPTNDTAVGDRHVVVGAGREYPDVAPLRGIYSGGATESMDTHVTITRLR
ncbi:UNVERIFIED_CONTAM: transglutaminase [Mumia flava]